MDKHHAKMCIHNKQPVHIVSKTLSPSLVQYTYNGLCERNQLTKTGYNYYYKSQPSIKESMYMCTLLTMMY
jgi:hypothetical protein